MRFLILRLPRIGVPQFIAFLTASHNLARLIAMAPQASDRARIDFLLCVIELLANADRIFKPLETSLLPTERRHNSYVWRRLQFDQATRAAENAYETLERIGYGGSGTGVRAMQQWAAADKA